ncbi:MAG: zinc ribbon domain-containing protein [Candidatus Lokiarchaeota archaeon]
MFGKSDSDNFHKKINCPNCKRKIDEGLTFCPECGKRIPEFLRFNPD